MKSLVNALARMWILLVIVVVVGAGGFVINRFHGVFGAPRPGGAAGADNIVSTVPKYVTYEVYGPADTSGMVSYVDERAQSQEAQFSHLPWTLTLTTTVPSVFANVVAQGDSAALGCRITVNGELRDERSADGFTATTSCLVKAA
ncbi:transport acessory protein MmpS [Mycobacterium sp. TNTM28]|uniref:Transport acessory protein MmpS n=1 Tax=[Mycobacterium] fortunisiensis TaxID=2600579 RepID=A0ABS6KG82_9MYCO|nr:MmpS family transport accessory protein [[Mycobacterium] fortunisiensis]MBU9762579.1 transport acessory protein MmpS [[Mycobacterium] fortunisiensis]